MNYLKRSHSCPLQRIKMGPLTVARSIACATGVVVVCNSVAAPARGAVRPPAKLATEKDHAQVTTVQKRDKRREPIGRPRVYINKKNRPIKRKLTAPEPSDKGVEG